MSDSSFRQEPVLFGADQTLMGVITCPAIGVDASGPVACLMLNMGANHRGGPHRINVKLAHRLASLGMTSLRMDLAGLGDSGPASSAERYLIQGIRDLQAGMDLIEAKFGIRRFVVVGLCSGTAHAMGLAVADTRVAGILMFDGYSFPSRRWYWERTFWRALAAPTNPAVIGKTIRWMRRKLLNIATTPPVDIFRVDEESPEEIQAIFKNSMNEITQRGVAVYLLYSGTQHVRDRSRDHLGPLVREPFAAKVKYEFARDIDHTFTSIAAQQAFMVRASAWALDIAAKFTVPASTGAASEPISLAAFNQRRAMAQVAAAPIAQRPVGAAAI
jgi:hypothetical protein